MDTDTLITVAFVAVIIAFQLFGSVVGRLLKKGRAPADRPAKAEGFLKTLTSRVNREIQLAMEQAAASREAASSEAGTPDLVAEEQVSVEAQPGIVNSRPAPARLRPVVKKPDMPVAADAVLEEKALIEEIRQGLLDASAGKKSGARAAAVEDSHVIAAVEPEAEYDASDLQRAVVWSEIIAPPVALRD